MEPTLKIIKAIFLLDSAGNRLIGKYYDDQFATTKEQQAFERSIFVKTCKADGEIMSHDGLTIVYRNTIDLYFYVIGSSAENEIMLCSILNCLYESTNQVLRRNMEKKYLMESMDSVMLILDLICDDGILLETDPTHIAQCVTTKNDADNIPLSEQTVFDVFRSAREQFKSSVFK